MIVFSGTELFTAPGLADTANLGRLCFGSFSFKRDENHSAFDFHIECPDTLLVVSAGLGHLPGFETNTPIVQRTGNSCAADDAVCERSTQMGATILNCKE